MKNVIVENPANLPTISWEILKKEYEPNALKDKKNRDVGDLKTSILTLGFKIPFIIWEEGKYIADGAGRFLALEILQYEGYNIPDLPYIPVKAKNKKEAKQLSMVISSQYGEITQDSLGEFTLDMGDIDLGFINIPNINTKTEYEVIEDDIPEVPKEAKSKLGDIYELGRHRLMCGDSTKDNDIDKLFKNTDKIKLIFTSPPYNMNGGMYENYQDNLKREEYIDFNLDIVNKWKEKLKGFIFWNISYNKNSRDEFIEIIYRIIKESGLKFLEMIVWNKKTAMPVISKEAMTRQYEDILVVGDDESIKEDIEMFGVFKNQKEAYFNTKTRKYLRNYWEISTLNSQLENHKACYPVELPARGISIMTNENDIVADPFGGSGSTLIACEQLNRNCYMMELDPKYIDVIIERWENFTGKKAKKINN